MRVAARKAIACLSLLVFTGSLALSSLPSRHVLVGLDADCASPFVLGHQDTQLDDATRAQSAPAEHCVLCHWLRAVGNARPAPTGVSAPAVIRRESASIARHVVPRDAARSDAPSRAPPVLSTL